MTQASLCCWAYRFESYLVANPEDRFSHDMAHTKGWFSLFSQMKNFTNGDNNDQNIPMEPFHGEHSLLSSD